MNDSCRLHGSEGAQERKYRVELGLAPFCYLQPQRRASEGDLWLPYANTQAHTCEHKPTHVSAHTSTEYVLLMDTKIQYVSQILHLYFEEHSMHTRD